MARKKYSIICLQFSGKLRASSIDNVQCSFNWAYRVLSLLLHDFSQALIFDYFSLLFSLEYSHPFWFKGRELPSSLPLNHGPGAYIGNSSTMMESQHVGVGCTCEVGDKCLAFVHWTTKYTMGQFLICDVQGREHCLLLIRCQYDHFFLFLLLSTEYISLFSLVLIFFICLSVIHIFALATFDATQA